MAWRDGDGWVACRCGRRHWGRHGAAGLVLLRPAGPRAGAATSSHVLLQHRARWVHDGGTWAVPGGARDSHEDVVAAALREAAEEVGVEPADVRVAATLTGTDHVDWRYDYVLGLLAPGARLGDGNEETEALAWRPLAAVPELPLHAGLARDWGRVAGLAERLLTAAGAGEPGDGFGDGLGGSGHAGR
ncbi:NUDIX domain-containing protein [Aquipuribacter sp. SD81]|uniref:NUDIX domain-containing protein n=1 Tax=Aquipuribacter sp. SD81 TaxID=3127703 RepID=UPI003016474B